MCVCVHAYCMCVCVCVCAGVIMGWRTTPFQRVCVCVLVSECVDSSGLTEHDYLLGSSRPDPSGQAGEMQGPCGAQ